MLQELPTCCSLFSDCQLSKCDTPQVWDQNENKVLCFFCVSPWIVSTGQGSSAASLATNSVLFVLNRHHKLPQYLSSILEGKQKDKNTDSHG